MLTPLGKAFTFFMVVLSVLALGVAMWVVADPVYATDPVSKGQVPSYKAKWDKLDREIIELKQQQKYELDGLQKVIADQRNLGRLVSFNPADPFGLANPAKLEDIKKAINEWRNTTEAKLRNDWTQAQIAITTLINDLDVTRGQVR